VKRDSTTAACCIESYAKSKWGYYSVGHSNILDSLYFGHLSCFIISTFQVLNMFSKFQIWEWHLLFFICFCCFFLNEFLRKTPFRKWIALLCIYYRFWYKGTQKGNTSKFSIFFHGL
jgi:hypothetical protein